jgi:uncharacterized Zn finger protein
VDVVGPGKCYLLSFRKVRIKMKNWKCNLCGKSVQYVPVYAPNNTDIVSFLFECEECGTFVKVASTDRENAFLAYEKICPQLPTSEEFNGMLHLYIGNRLKSVEKLSFSGQELEILRLIWHIQYYRDVLGNILK